MEEAFLKDFLFPDEVMKFKSRKRMKFAGGRYMIYLTNQRLIAHRQRGLLRKDDVILVIVAMSQKLLNCFKIPF